MMITAGVSSASTSSMVSVSNAVMLATGQLGNVGHGLDSFVVVDQGPESVFVAPLGAAYLTPSWGKSLGSPTLSSR